MKEHLPGASRAGKARAETLFGHLPRMYETDEEIIDGDAAPRRAAPRAARENMQNKPRGISAKRRAAYERFA